jgi:head-tail adaptor
VNEAIPPIGTLTDRVQLKRREMTGESEGGHVALFVPVTSLWARVRSLTGRQGTSADGRAVEISHAWSCASAMMSNRGTASSIAGETLTW